jgi:hypothetical protein
MYGRIEHKDQVAMFPRIVKNCQANGLSYMRLSETFL